MGAETTIVERSPLPPRPEGEPGWLSRRRAEAWEAYLSSRLPDRVSHLWRYSDPEPYEADSMPGACPPLVRSRAAEPRPRGIETHDLVEACRSYPALTAGHLGVLVPPAHGRFEAWNLATWNAGRFLYVSEGHRVEGAVDLRLDLGECPDVTSARTLIVVEQAAEVTVVTGLSGGRPGQLVNQVVEIHAAAGTRVRLSGLLTQADGVRVHRTQRALVGRDGSLVQLLASLGGSATKVDTGTRLAGPGADVQFFGFAFGTGKQRFDHHTAHEHGAGHTTSNLDFKVVLGGRARSAYTGNIRIDEGAGASEAYQENRNLLLDEGPRAESIPELEILTDDVRCSHGSTTGPIDEEQVHYLCSRGIPRRDAERLIVSGFLDPTLRRLPAPLAEALRAETAKKLEES